MTSATLAPELTREEHTLAMHGAAAYLDKLNLGDDEFDPNIADKDGLVSYINGTTNPPPPELVKERSEVARVLEGLTGIVTSAVLATAGDDDKAKHQPKLWEDPIRFGLAPFMSGISTEETTYNRTVVGVDIATQFLNILIDAVATMGGALPSFTSYLANQGSTIQLKGENTEEGYKYACVGMVHEIFQIEGSQWIYAPKIRAYFTQFTRETFKISAGCASVEKFKFDFQVSKLVAPFKIETWRQDPEFRDDVNNFIKKYNRAQIEQSENYFDGIFNSRK